MDDQIKEAQRGSREALNRLIADHYAAVYRFCARRLGEELAKDAAQDVFLTMQKNLKTYQGASAFSTWLFGIAHNRTRELIRSKKKEPLPLSEWLADGSGPAEEGLIAKESLRQALASLSEDHRQVVLMHEIEGFKYCEIAGILSIPEGTVKSRLHHAFLSLRRSLCEGQ
jgi:RNA polymerase sigma-70 factor (ECF subfamily)